MSKFIGEMSFDEFIEALKIIFQSEKENSDEATKKITIKEHLQNGTNEFVDTIKYIFSAEPLKDIWNTILDFIKFIRYVFSTQCWSDLKSKIETFFDKQEQPLTQEIFIKKGKKFKSALWEIVDTVIFVVIMVVIIRFFIGEIRWIPSGSMHPTLLEGDRIFVERFSRFNSTPQRGDIMVFYPPFERIENTPVKLFARLTGFFCKDTAFIKRVIGLPGDKFEIKTDNMGKNTVYINDAPLEEPYIMSAYDYPACTKGMVCGPIIIPDDNYMMLGDNRGNSQDGRYWGLLNKDRFIGKAVFLFWPFNRMKSLKQKNL